MIQHLKKCWNGQEKLAIVFFLYGIIGISLLSLIEDYLEPFNNYWTILFGLFTLIYMTWVYVSIWRSSRKYALIIKIIARSPIYLTLGILALILVFYFLSLLGIPIHINIRLPINLV